MTIQEETSIGTIHISSNAIRSLACQAAVNSYGVVGMAEHGWFESWMHPTAKDPRRGVDVRLTEDGDLLLDVYIIIEYGTRIATVADSVAQAVRFSVERALGVAVGMVNIHVQGLRVSDPD